MEVQVLESTDSPERLVCQAARGDYFEGYVGDTEYAELMESVEYDEDDVESVIHDMGIATMGGSTLDAIQNPAARESAEVQAKTKSFIETQLSRGHYGPWEHPQITFTVKGVSRVTMAQITRHRHLTFDIQSMRYADFSEAEPIVPKSVTDPEHQTRREGMVWYDMDSDVPLDEQEADVESMEEAEQLYERAVENALKAYQAMQKKGVPDEDARYALPLGTPVNMTFSGNARSFLHLLDMRKKANAQWEIRELSEKLLDELFEWCPYTFNYYEEHGPNKLSP